MSLVERLGYKSLNNLYAEMDCNDIMEWAAYDLTQNTEWKEKIDKQIQIEKQKEFTAEEEAAAIKAMFQSLGSR